MKVRTLLFAATFALIGAGTAFAQTDVTSTYLTNSDFSQGTPVTMDVFGYQKDAGTSLYWAQDVEGWTVATAKADASAGGLFAYGGTPLMRGNSATAPEAGPNGESGNALGLFAVWGSAIQYTQQAKTQLAAGQYTLTYTYYSYSGTGKVNNRIGFIEADGTTHYCTVDTFAVGAWTTTSYTFGLSAPTAGQFSLGYQSRGSGSGANPMLYIDNVKLTYTAVVVKDGLKTAIDKANEANATLNSSVLAAAIAAAQAVYDNSAATQDEVTNAVATLNAAVEKAKADAIAAANAENPLDMSSYITNPSYDNNNNTGWGGDGPGFQSFTDAEFFSKNYDYRQIIKGLPKGVYGLTLQAFYRAGSTDESYTNYQNGTEQRAKMFAQVTNDTITAPIVNIFSGASDTKLGVGSEVSPTQDASLFVPNNMEAAEEYFKQGKYSNSLLFSVAADSTIIGLRKTSTISNDWTIWDNWGLKYYGNGQDAYTMWMKSMVAQTPSFDKLPEDTYVTTSMVEAYNAAKAGYTSASSEAEVLAAFKALNADADSINTNIDLWKQLLSVRDKANDQVVNDDNINGDDKDDLADYIEGELQEKIDDRALTNDEIRAEIANLEVSIKNAIDNGISPGTDVTNKYLVNADFEKTSGDGTGWTVTRTGGGNVRYGGNDDNHCFEAWNSPSFDIHQEVKGAPVGVYSISVQGFFRYGSGNDQNYARYENGEAAPYQDAVKVYVNDNTSSFANVYDVKTNYGSYETAPYSRDGAYVTADSVYWYANSMSTAATMFKAGYYKTSSYGIVAKKGDVLRVGVKGSTDALSTSWAIWDNFNMVFEGTDAKVVKPLLDAKVKEVQDTLANSTRIFGKGEVTATQADIATAQEASNGGDGQAMFEALSALITDQTTLNSSALVFDSLATQAEALSQALAEYGESASPADVATASSLYDEVSEHISAKDLETAQARDYIGQMQAAASKLRIPGDYTKASKENPVDFTSVIVNPGYDVDGANSINGWNCSAGYNFGNNDAQKAALLLEYYNKNFDMSQTLKGLPKGQYRIEVSAFYRWGGASDDYKHFTNGDVQDRTMLYAYAPNATEGTVDTLKVPVALLATGAREDPGYGSTGSDESIVDASKNFVVPNQMTTAASWFRDGYYKNSLTFNLQNDGTMTIGIRTYGNPVDADWVIFDDWKLSYLGDDPTAIKGVTDNTIGKAKISEVYNLSGARQNGLQKGVNIVKFTDAEGKTVVKKVILK